MFLVLFYVLCYFFFFFFLLLLLVTYIRFNRSFYNQVIRKSRTLTMIPLFDFLNSIPRKYFNIPESSISKLICKIFLEISWTWFFIAFENNIIHEHSKLRFYYSQCVYKYSMIYLSRRKTICTQVFQSAQAKHS